MIARPRGFLFDIDAWRSSRRVQRMTAAERGLYLEMLIEQWDKAEAPATPDACEERIGVAPLEEWRGAWPKLIECFKKRSGGELVNLKLQKVRLAQKKYFREQAERGRLGGKAAQRKRLARKHRLSDAQPPLKQNQAIRSDLIRSDLRRSDQRRSTEQDQEQSRPRDDPRPPVENSDNYRVILKIAHEVLDHYPDAPIGDMVEGVKELCAKRAIDYRGNVVQRALDSAIVQRGGHV